MGILGPLGMMLPRLGLSDAQREQVKGILDARQGDLQPLMQNEGAARQALESAQLGGDADANIRQLQANVSAIEADLAVARTHLIADLLTVLTPDQQATLRTMRNRPPPQGPPPGPR